MNQSLSRVCECIFVNWQLIFNTFYIKKIWAEKIWKWCSTLSENSPSLSFCILITITDVPGLKMLIYIDSFNFWNSTSRKHVTKVHMVCNFFFFFTAQYLTKPVAYGVRVPSSIFKENKSSCTVFPLIISGTKKSLRLSELSIKKTIKKKQPSLYNIFWKCIWYRHIFLLSAFL